jgi:ribonuclease HI
MIKYLDIPKLPNLQQSIEDNDTTIYIVSDGGVHKYEGNYGVVIAQGINILASTKGKIYSVEFHESSYRSELHGMLAGVVMLRHIIKEYSINWPKGKKVEIYCDNKAAVTTISLRLEARRTVNQHCKPDVDVEQQLVQELSDLRKNGSTIKIQHVQGHQDTNTNIRRELTYEEILNVAADKLTYEARSLPSIQEYNEFRANKVDLTLNTKVINSNYSKMVNLAFHSIAL